MAYQALFRPELDAEAATDVGQALRLGMPVSNDAGTVKNILDHIGESTQPPRIAPARGQPLWETAAAAEQAENDPQSAGGHSPGIRQCLGCDSGGFSANRDACRPESGA